MQKNPYFSPLVFTLLRRSTAWRKPHIMMKRLLPYTLCVACLILGLPSAAQEAPSRSDGVAGNPDLTVFGRQDPRIRKAAAIVNGSVITDLDVDERLSLVVAASGGRIQPEERLRLRLQVLRNLIDERLQILEAKEHDVVIDDPQVDEAYNRVAQNFKQSGQQFEAFLKANGASPATLKDQIRAELAWNRLLRRRVEPFVSIGDEEVQAVIDRLQASKGQNEFRVGEIFLSATQDNENEVRTTAERIIKQIRGGASFVAYARQFSEASTAAVGGDLGYVQAAQLSPGIRELVPNLPIGQISDPIRVPGGFSIIIVNDKRKILGPEPTDAILTVKEVLIPLKEGATQQDIANLVKEMTAGGKTMGGCGGAEKFASKLNGTVNVPDPQPLRNFPEGLHQQLINLQVGEVTRPFGTNRDARMIVLCGKDEATESSGPSYDEIYAQMNEQKVSLMARRYLRDLRRDAIVDYR